MKMLIIHYFSFEIFWPAYHLFINEQPCLKKSHDNI